MSIIETSEKIDTLIAAIAVAQSGMEPIRKERENQAFKSKYATLGAVLDAVVPALLANNIVLMQPISSDASGAAVITTTLTHTSGQFIRSAVTIRPTKSDPQGFGSAVTYGRRYGVLAMLGLAPDEDDDGNAASRKTEPQRQKPQAKLTEPARNEAAGDYMAEWMAYIANADDIQEIRNTWAGEKQHQIAAGLTKQQIDELINMTTERCNDIRAGSGR